MDIREFACIFGAAKRFRALVMHTANRTTPTLPHSYRLSAG